MGKSTYVGLIVQIEPMGLIEPMEPVGFISVLHYQSNYISKLGRAGGRAVGRSGGQTVGTMLCIHK